MRLLLIYSLITITLQICDDKSLSYKCSEEKLSSDKCLVMNNNNRMYYLRNCPIDQKCQIVQQNNEVKLGFCVYRIRQLFGGEKCGINAECYSNNCTNSYCVSITDGQPCTNSYGCSSKSYCSNKICTALGGEQSECKEDEECQAGLACGSVTSGQLNKKCVKMFSIPKDQYASNRLLCETGYLYTSGSYNPFDKDGICASSELKSNQSCRNNADCSYSILTSSIQVTTYGNCECTSDGYNSTCAITTDNAKWQNWLSLYKKTIDGIIIRDYQNTVYLREHNWGNTKLMQASVDVEKFQLLQNADECAIRYHSSSQLLKTFMVFLVAFFVLIL